MNANLPMGVETSSVATGSSVMSSTFRPLEIFTVIAVVYFLICWPLAQSIRVWEKRLAAR